MSPAQRHYEANKDKPEFKARRLAAVKRYDQAQREASAAREDATVQPVVGERFDAWLSRWAESEGRALFAARAAALHERLAREAETRKRNSLVAIERVRARKVDAPSQRTVAAWRQPGQFLAGPGAVSSVFALGAL